MQKAVFLDRDGVINDNRKPVNHPGDLVLYPQTGKAIRKLNEAGYLVFVVTNQGGVGLGYLSEEDLERVHMSMIEKLNEDGAVVHDIQACIHRPNEGCVCRKPDAGMIFNLAEKYDINLDESYMVGDRLTDIEAGIKAGTKTILICTHKRSKANYRAENLYEAVKWILRNH